MRLFLEAVFKFPKYYFINIFLGFFFLPLVAEEQVNWQEKVYQIDQHIIELKELQEKYRFSAQKNANNAMQWQFQNENYADARKAWEKAAQDKQKVKDIQDKIDELETQKQQILKEHGSSPSS